MSDPNPLEKPKPSGIDALLAQARASFHRGNMAEAERFILAAVDSQPEHAVANLMLGNLLVLKGDLQGAERHFRIAAEEDPNAYEPREWLANIARESGKLDQAEAFSKELVRRWPQAVGGNVSLALCYLKQRRPQDAIPVLSQAISLAPRSPVLHHNLAGAYRDANQPEDAILEYKIAISLAPQVSNSYFALATALIEQKRHEEAVAVLSKVLEFESTAYANTQMAHALGQAERYEEAEKYLRKAIEIDPGDYGAHETLGIRLLDLGMFEEAVRSFEKAIAIDPDRAGPYFGISRCRRFGESDREMVRKMVSMTETPRRSPEELRELHYGIAKAFDEYGEYEAAMGHFDLANKFSRQTQLVGRPYSHDREERQIDQICSTFSKRFFERHKDFGLDSDVPIFIVGMIRSGTTLTEQIISSHPDVGAAGELRFWIEAQDTEAVASIEKGVADKAALRSLASDYLASLRSFAPDKPHVTDKMPLNYFSLGLMYLMFPNARFIHCKRNPLDTCLSIYMTPFQASPEFFYDKRNIVHGYLQYERLMEHWRAILPAERFFEVRYEDLVADRVAVLPRLLEFCGLPWDDAVLKHETNERTIRTPSSWQARQPIYHSSVEKWKRYEPWLGEFAQLISK